MNNRQHALRFTGRRLLRRAYTLIELIVAVGATTVLMAGLSSSILLASRTLTADSPASTDGNRSDLILSRLSADLGHSLRFTERTATAATFVIPDRNTDGKPETARYWWSGAVGDPLQYSYNGGPARTLAENVQRFNIGVQTRAMKAESLNFPSATAVTYRAFTEAKVDEQYVFLPTPTGTESGNLLVALVVVSNEHAAKAMAGGGWHRLARDRRNADVSGAVWWKIAGPNEPAAHFFYWMRKEKAYAAMMRFSGVDPAAPVNAFAYSDGDNSSPQCPSVTTTVANTTILRVGAFHKDKINVDNAGMSGYSTITMDKNGGDISGGAAYATFAPIGATGTSNFTLTGTERHLTFTLALAPNAAN